MRRRLGQQPIEADVRWLRVLLGKCGLAQPGGWLPFAAYGVLPGSGITNDASLPFAATISRAMTVRSWHQTTVVVTTNDGSNYWSLTLKRASDATTIITLDTSALSPGSLAVLSSAGLALALTTSHLGLYVRANKTGSPGALYLYAPAVFVT